MFSALLDTSVLWPSAQRDFFLSMGIEGIFRPLWSSAILEELREAECWKLKGRGVPSVDARRRSQQLIFRMEKSFPDAKVKHWHHLVGTFQLPDPNDEHVAAAAVVGGAGVLVTDNTRHFPRKRIPAEVDLQDSGTFALSAVSANPDAALRAIQQMASRHQNPPQNVDRILGILRDRYHMTDAVTLLEAVLP